VLGVVLPLLLLQMALAHAESGGVLFSGPVVVLADRDRGDMQEEVRQNLRLISAFV
jgi:hypothetical protein